MVEKVCGARLSHGDGKGNCEESRERCFAWQENISLSAQRFGEYFHFLSNSMLMVFCVGRNLPIITNRLGVHRRDMMEFLKFLNSHPEKPPD